MIRTLTFLLSATSLAALGLACGDPPAQDPSDLTQFPAASSAPAVQAPPAGSSDALWPDAGFTQSK